MLQRQIASWDQLAQTDPFWAVLTSDEKRQHPWDKEAFFATGKADVQKALDRLRQYNRIPATGKALDFGCGLGRLSRALTPHFARVVGMDISAVMITKAAELTQAGNLEFRHNPALDLRQLGSNDFSFILSLISLQHMPGSMAASYIGDMGRILRPGGLAYLQLSSFLDVRHPYARAKLTRDESGLNLAYRAVREFFQPKAPRMDTDYCRLSRVLTILERQRLQLVAVLPDDSLPAPFISHVVIFEKPIIETY